MSVYDEIYQEAFNDELEKVASGPFPSSIRKAGLIGNKKNNPQTVAGAIIGLQPKHMMDAATMAAGGTVLDYMPDALKEILIADALEKMYD